MKKIANALALFSLVLGLMACEKTYDSVVEGRVVNSSTNEEFDVFWGTLSESGGDWYGSCTLDGDNLSFEVGHDDQAHVSGGGQFNLNITGIVGPAGEGVWQEPAAVNYIDDKENRYTEFGTVVFTNVDEWVISNEVAAEVPNQNCAVQLFSTPGPGEVTPTSHTFDYFIKIDCRGLTGVKPTGKQSPELPGFEVELYFERCD